MAYDEGLAERIRDVLVDVPDVTEKKMFGGLCLLVSGNMCCGIVDDTLMARVGPDQYEECLKLPHAREMDFTGKPLKSMVYVKREGLRSKVALEKWVKLAADFARTLPAK